MSVKRHPNQYHWVTGRDVNTNEPAGPEDPGLAVEANIDLDGDAEESGPNKSDNKPVWLEHRKEQGYTDEQLESLNKEELIELPDDPAEFEPKE